MAMTQSTPAHFDWATEVDEALSLIPIECNTTQSTSANPAPILPGDPVPNDVIVDLVHTRYANACSKRLSEAPKFSVSLARTLIPPNSAPTPTNLIPAPIADEMAHNVS